MVNLGKTEAREVFHQVVQQAGFTQPSRGHQKNPIEVHDLALERLDFLGPVRKVGSGDDATVFKGIAHVGSLIFR